MNLPPDTALRRLDAATTTLTAGQQQRAAATLDRIVTTSPWHDAARLPLPRRHAGPGGACSWPAAPR